MEEEALGSRLAVSRLQPLSNAGSWQRSALGPAKDAAIREEQRRSSGIHGLNGRGIVRVSSWVFEWRPCVRGNHVFGWWRSLVHGAGKPTGCRGAGRVSLGKSSGGGW